MSSSKPGGSNVDVKTSLNELLTPVVGDFIAKTSISMASKRIGKSPESITTSDLPDLANALRPALRTVLGAPSGDRLIAQILALGDRKENAT